MEIDNGYYDINGTSITLSHMENLDIFDLNNDQMKYLIRTKLLLVILKKYGMIALILQ